MEPVPRESADGGCWGEASRYDLGQVAPLSKPLIPPLPALSSTMQRIPRAAPTGGPTPGSGRVWVWEQLWSHLRHQSPHAVRAPTDPRSQGCLAGPGRPVHLLDTWAEESCPWGSAPHLPCLPVPAKIP